MLGLLLVADTQPSPVAEPGHRAFNDIANSAQATLVLAATRSQPGLDFHGQDKSDGPCESVATVAKEGLGLADQRPVFAFKHRQGLEHQLDGAFVSHVGGSDMHRQRQAVGVGDEVAFCAFFTAIYWVGPGVEPPKTARTDCESMTA